MYYNEEHKRKVEERGDGYEYIGSYKSKEITIDGKKSKPHIRIRCPYCNKEYDIRLDHFKNGGKCTNCCNEYRNSLAYYIEVKLNKHIDDYWDWDKNNKLNLDPYYITPQSNKKVWIKCTEKDYHESYLIMVSNFYKGRRCPQCSCRHGKVHPKDSFGQYLIDTYGEDAIKKYWSSKNTLDPFKISKRNKKSIWILCQNKDYHNDNGGYKTTCDDFYNGNRCSYCSSNKIHPKDSFAQWCIDNVDEDFMTKYWSDKNTVNPFEISKHNSYTKIWLYCQDKDYHNDNGGYFTLPASFYNGNRCSYCNPFASHKVHRKDSFGYKYPDRAKHWSKNNKKTPYEVTPRSSKKYKFICEKCGKEFERSLSNMTRYDNGVVCLECNISQLEYKTKEILVKYNVEYKVQVEYKGLIGLKGGNLSYDFYLPNYNLLIECQGIQHEKFTKGFHESKKDFEKQLEHDRRKREYAKEHNINLLEIWYYDINNIENILIEKLHIENN